MFRLQNDRLEMHPRHEAQLFLLANDALRNLRGLAERWLRLHVYGQIWHLRVLLFLSVP